MAEHMPDWVPSFERGQSEGRTEDERFRHYKIQLKLTELEDRANRLAIVEAKSPAGIVTTFRSEHEFTNSGKVELEKLESCISHIQNLLRTEADVRRSQNDKAELHQRVSAIFDQIETLIANFD